jgi:LacI family transcriptional regulator
VADDVDLIEEAAFDAPSGHRAMVAILERTHFEAVFVASDVVALGAIGALREAGRRVPDDVSVVGFDDIPLAAYFDPALTTVRLPAFELGQAAGRALIRRLAGDATTTRTLLPTQLIVRASTARPPSMMSRRCRPLAS